MIVGPILQPDNASTIDVLCRSLRTSSVTKIDIAVAYITTTGLRDLFIEANAQIGPKWDDIGKRWLTSLDYMRTEPVALRMLETAPNSQLRINDSDVLNVKGCVPAVPFHPKVFIIGGQKQDCVLAGSGNLSRSGLRRGHEAGFLIGVTKPVSGNDKSGERAVKAFNKWFRKSWADADQCDANLIERYGQIYRRADNLRNPTPTEDDVAPTRLGSSQLTPDDLRKLRACEHFWIEAGNITKNLGQNRPGNQLMMRRLSRVFFGVPPIDVPQNSPLTHVEIAFDGHEPRECSLTFSDNGMDKLTLPLPGTFGPPSYDNKNLHFRRVKPGFFELATGTAAQKQGWKARSKAIDASFSMSGSGRAWGVF